MDIKNPTDINAVIAFEGKNLKEVVPDEFAVSPGATVQWDVIPNETVKVVFKDESPCKNGPTLGANGKITATIKRSAIGVYPYSVIDVAGNVIDPRIQVKP